MILCNDFVNKKLKQKSDSNSKFNSNSNSKFNTNQKSKFNSKPHSRLLKAGIIIGIGLTIHNLPEGLAIGSGFEASSTLGLSLAIAICIHDFPEGISMAVPLKQGGFSKLRVILYTAISGISTGVGALLGALIGSVSPILIGFSLSFAARSNALYCFLRNYS